MRFLYISLLFLVLLASGCLPLKEKVLSFINVKESPTRIPMPEIPIIKRNDLRAFNQLKKNSPKAPKKRRSYDRAFILESYQLLFGRPPRNDEFAQKMSMLSQGGSRDALYRGLVLSPEYSRLERGETISTSDFQQAQKIIKKYSRNFFNSESDLPSRATVKRVLVETLADVFEALAVERYKAEDWYAHLSVDIAKAYEAKGIKASKMRMSLSIERHKLWAKMVPNEFILAEIILKTHLLFGSPKRDGKSP